MGSTLDILKRLTDAKVEFVLVGGMAGVAHGSSIVTEDLDVCAPITIDNVTRILRALDDLNPLQRMMVQSSPLPRDAALLSTYKNLYLLTDIGQVDFLGEITGVGSFNEVRCHCVDMIVGGSHCRVLDLTTLIRAKRALGRQKDLQAALELEAILQQLKKRNPSDESK